jgi:hypothetical protein
MLPISQVANTVFDELIIKYHILDDISQQIDNPYPTQQIAFLLYQKCWIDSIQWHVEDLVREPGIDPSLGLSYKHLIDKLNQQRTDTVEKIDDFYVDFFSEVVAQPHARLNTESPAWVIDRLSILALKIYHMQQETFRADLSTEKILATKNKLATLLEQRKDLSQSIDELLEDISSGEKRMKVYRQMKMYNDPESNPVIYKKNKG